MADDSYMEDSDGSLSAAISLSLQASGDAAADQSASREMAVDTSTDNAEAAAGSVEAASSQGDAMMMGSPVLSASAPSAQQASPGQPPRDEAQGAAAPSTSAAAAAAAARGAEFTHSLSQLLGLSGPSGSFYQLPLGGSQMEGSGSSLLARHELEIAESVAESLMGSSHSGDAGALRDAAESVSAFFRGIGGGSDSDSGLFVSRTGILKSVWHSLNPETAEWEPLEPAMNTALEEVVQAAGGDHVEFSMDGNKFVGTSATMKLHPAGGGPAREMRCMVSLGEGREGSAGDVNMEDAGIVRARGESGRSKASGTLMETVPKTATEWQSVMGKICESLNARPFLVSALDDVQRTVHVLLDGRKAGKSRGSGGLRKGDLVFTTGGENDEQQSKRGVVETEHSDGTVTVRWHSPVQQTTRIAASAVRPLNRISNMPSSTLPLNQYLLSKALPLKDARMVSELVREGADPCCLDDAGNSAIAVAVSKGCPPAVLHALLQGGADTAVAGPLGSPLQIAAKAANVDLVECLLQAGADCTGIDTSEGSGVSEGIAEMLQRHKAMVLPEEAKQQAKNDCVSTILPLLFGPCLELADISSQHNTVGFISYVMDKATVPILEKAFPSGPSSPGLLPLLRILQVVESSESLDVLYYALRITMSLIEKMPESSESLRSRGILRWISRLSDAKAVRQDAQAGLLTSKTGRVKDKHISKLASDIVAKASPTSPQTRPALASICDRLREGQPGAVSDLSRFLVETTPAPGGPANGCLSDALAAADLSGCDLIESLTALLSGPGADRHWRELARGGGLRSLVQPLVHLISTDGVWGVGTGGGDNIQDLVSAMRVELLQKDVHSARAAASPSGAAAAGAGAPPMIISVEPMLLLSELSKHVLRTVHPPPEYIEYCHLLVGSSVMERPASSKNPFASAKVVAFELVPPEAPADTQVNAQGQPMSGADPDSTASPLSLDPATLAACLTLTEEHGKPLVTCNKKGNPAGIVQATRAFSREADGPLAYYEVLVKRRGPSGAIGVGLAQANYSKNKMPGWEPTSHAWHGDDGCTFNSCGTGAPFSNPWAEGDVIGCGIDFNKKTIFLTRNGALQGAPFTGVDTAGLYAIIGCQTKGECVSVSFQPPFLYDLSTHVLTQPLVPIHHLRYEDGTTRMMNLLIREYVITAGPEPLGPCVDRVRTCIATLAANSQRADASAAASCLVSFIRSAASEGANASMTAADVSSVVACKGGEELLAAIGLQVSEDGSASFDSRGQPSDFGDLVAYCDTVEKSIGVVKRTDAGAGGEASDEAAQRVNTVMIVIPDGFPPELFFEEVEDAVRMALSTPDPTVAPASGNVGDSYRWPDRGFEHEEVWYESLMSSLAEKQAGAVARGQTEHEAEVLAGRLRDVVQTEVVVDEKEDYTKKAREAKRGQAGMTSAGLMVGNRAQVMDSNSEWVFGTILHIDHSRFGVICDDGTWLPGVPIEQIRSARGGARGADRRSLLDQDLLFDGGLDARVQDILGGGRPTADLRRQYSCFEVGDVNRDGCTAPKNRIDLCSEGAVLPPQPIVGPPPGGIKPARLKVSFHLASTQAGEMQKVKKPEQLKSVLDKGAGRVSCILFIDAPARPPVGQSWPRHIHSASSMVKDLATRFGEASFIRVLSGTSAESLDKFGLPRTGFPPTIVLLVDGVEEGRWTQQAGSETIWMPAQVGGGTGEGGGSLWKQLHRNLFGALIQSKTDEWRAEGRLRSGRDGALAETKTVFECLSDCTSADGSKPPTNVFHYEVSYTPGEWAAARNQGRLPVGNVAKRSKLSSSGGDSEMASPLGSSGAMDICEEERAAAQPGAEAPPEGVGDKVLSALELLALLYRLDGGTGGPEWESKTLTKRLSKRLDDAVCFASRALPPWCSWLPHRAPFVFSVDARRKLLDCTGFGSSHAVYRMQECRVAAHRAKLGDHIRAAQQRLARAREHQDFDGIARATDEVDEIERRVYSKRIGAIASDLARVSREKILENAMVLLEYHGSSRHILEVQFHGEDGFGSGVTQNFYEAVSWALQLRSLNKEAPMWVSDGRDVEAAAEPDGQYAYLTNPEGLFPQPLSLGAPERKRVCELYRFMGNLMGKACRDKFTVPLPLHPHFFAVLKGGHDLDELMRSFGRESADIPQGEDWTSMDLLRAYADMCASATNEEELAALGQGEFTSARLSRSFACTLEDFLSQSGAKFVDPLTGDALFPGGEEQDLVVTRLPEFVRLVADMWFVSGIEAQLAAFREGLSAIFPSSALNIFGAAELSVMLCGEKTIEWNKEMLEKSLKLVSNEQGQKFTKDCKPYQIFLDELCDMTNKDRSKFLDFVTSCPRLPPGGLASLNIEIAPESSKSLYPRSRTCTNLMWLPQYTTREDLRERLHTALANSKDGGFHEHNEVRNT